ncbi:class I SAM-dependent methyltransferase [Candidatus Dojkabacteria bacterium]|uniref:Class I SAM-dependent methyltransferase n=1 Tax=Candidatus Dojkabacteria bacterium TaxID=2099670 RepID=A0A3M0Z1C3_9BACT|nr:MAG: class I SAM-dependent methyltransferase [Candidatus Dojkabacteria bacterium]
MKSIMMVSEIGEYLDRLGGNNYLDSINGTSAEDFAVAIQKLMILDQYANNGDHVLSVGVGQGEELQAIYRILRSKHPKIYGLDISSVAISRAKERMIINQIPNAYELILGDASNIPILNNRINIVVLSAILHEVYSYNQNGIDMWRQTIRESFRVLSPGGVVYVRDFCGPEFTGDVLVEFKDDLSRNFYNVFRKHYRKFESWNGDFVPQIVTPDFPPLSSDGNVILPMGLFAELAMHFRNFWNDCQKDYVSLDTIKDWKEINETYFILNESGKVMTPEEYLSEIREILGSSVSVDMFRKSERITTAKFIQQYLGVRQNNIDPNSLNGSIDTEVLLLQATSKMEIILRKQDN